MIGKVIFSGTIRIRQDEFGFTQSVLSDIKFIKGSEVDFGNAYGIFLTIFPSSIYTDYTCLYSPERHLIHIVKSVNCLTSNFYNTEFIFYTGSDNFEENLKIDREIHEILNNNGS